MTREIILLVLLSTGEVEQTQFNEEWPCVQKALEHNERGQQAWCIIETPDEVGILIDYPDVPWPASMWNMWKSQ